VDFKLRKPQLGSGQASGAKFIANAALHRSRIERTFVRILFK
jgi:hypothetical protein